MNAPANLDRLAALHLDKRFLEQLLRVAINDGAHPRIIRRLLELLAENAHATGQAWHTRQVKL